MARLLLMEDDAEEGELLAEIIRRDGHEVVLLPNATACFAHLETHPVDLLLSDIFVKEDGQHVPNGGLLLISKLRQIDHISSQKLPIIAISGGFAIKGGASALRAARDVGADVLFEKPVPIDELLLTIRELLQRDA
ncbi:MAG: response regulator [Rhodobacteraceae bacterium]|nr:response regulator [Paracoccaceae bacterium]